MELPPPLFLGGGYEKMTKDIKSEIVIGRLPPPPLKD